MDTNAIIDFLQPLLGYFGDRPVLQAAIAFGLALIFAKLIAIFLGHGIGRLVRRTDSRLDDEVTALSQGPLIWTVILVGALVALRLLDLPDAAHRIGRAILLSALTLAWSVFVVRIVRTMLLALSRRGRPDSVFRPQTLPLFNNVTIVIVLGAAVYAVFQIWNIDMTAWLASAGIIGIAIGFAAKDTLANLFSGVFILADAPYKIGNYVVLESGERGKVTHIGIRSTRLLTRDDVEVTIPNAIMGNTRIINQSGGPHEKFRLRVKVGVAYGSDIDQVRTILMQIAADEPGVCDLPEPRVRFRLFGASSLDFELLCWIDNPELRGRVLDTLNCSIYKQFAAQAIEIPYSKHDVFIKEMPPGAR